MIHDHSIIDPDARIEEGSQPVHRNFGICRDSAREISLPENYHPRLDDFLRVKSFEPNDEPDFEDLKDPETGLHDVHLEDIRKDEQTMYMEIYGIPETLLSLISQTTRLANVMDIFHSPKSRAVGTSMYTLQAKAVRLEQMICAFASDREVRFVNEREAHKRRLNERSEKTGKLSFCANQAMLKALSSALVIFFYRRVRRVHPGFCKVMSPGSSRL